MSEGPHLIAPRACNGPRDGGGLRLLDGETPIAKDGRKHLAGSALLDADGNVKARA